MNQSKRTTLNTNHIHVALSAIEACSEAWGVDLVECNDSGPNGRGSEPRMMAYLLAFEKIKSGPWTAMVFNRHHDSIYSGIRSIKDLISTNKAAREKSEEARKIFQEKIA